MTPPVAIVSSTISPGGQHASLPAGGFSPADRLAQTRETVVSLQNAGISEIVIADNSPDAWVASQASALAPARLVCFEHPSFENKGIGESWLLLSAVKHLPDNRPVLKISGRYQLGPDSLLLAVRDADVAARVYTHGRRSEVSTRAYAVRNRSVAEKLWRGALDDIYAHPARIVGPRSFWRLLRNSLLPASEPRSQNGPGVSLEFATWRAIKRLGLSLEPVNRLSLRGAIGQNRDSIDE